MLTAQLSNDTSNATLLVVGSTASAAALAASSLLTDSYPWPFIRCYLPTREVGGRKGLARAANLHHGAHALTVH